VRDGGIAEYRDRHASGGEPARQIQPLGRGAALAARDLNGALLTNRVDDGPHRPAVRKGHQPQGIASRAAAEVLAGKAAQRRLRSRDSLNESLEPFRLLLSSNGCHGRVPERRHARLGVADRTCEGCDWSCGRLGRAQDANRVGQDGRGP
jgi:hypothetical protein